MLTYWQISNLQLRVAAHQEVDADAAPGRGREYEQELVARCGDCLGAHCEVVGACVVEGEGGDGCVGGGVPMARAGEEENWVWYW